MKSALYRAIDCTLIAVTERGTITTLLLIALVLLVLGGVLDGCTRT